MKEKITALTEHVKYLPLARKLVLAGAAFTLIFLLFPWGTHGIQGEKYEFVPENFSAFGIFPIFGWLLLILALFALLLLWRETSQKKISFWGLSPAHLWGLSGAIGIYTVILALFVLNSTYLKSFDSQFGLKLGIFLTLFAQALVLLGGMLARKDEARDYLKESLAHPHEVDTSRAHLNAEEIENEKQMTLGDYDR